MKTIIVKVNDSFHRLVKERARRSERTMSQYVRDVLTTNEHPLYQPHNLGDESKIIQQYGKEA
tara:strand:- start:6263 stop:6451 length:189 start_codon:yes stop_codon:yes gene_type:complete